MLKHVSYRASSTSLTRQFGNCRSSNTIGAHGKSPVSDVDSLISAPNSPHMYGRHSRHHSVTPESSPLTHDEVDGHKRHTIQAKLPVTSHTTLVTINSSPENPASSTCVVTQATDITYNRDNHVRPPPSTESSEDSLSLKADDPLSKHKNDLRCVDSMAVQAELMSDGAQRQHTDNSDNISLHSAISLTSLCRNDLRASTTSLSTSKVPVRVHLRQLRPDIEYKTLKLDPEMSCRQLIEHLLQKLRLKHRDPNLFAVVLEVAVKGPGGAPPVKKRFLLEDSARPVELQQCRPRGEANFSITMRRGGVLRVRDSVLTPGSQYKSVLVSYTSSVVEVIQLLLRCNNRSEDWRLFTLHEVCSAPYNDRLLNDDERPLHVQSSWPRNDKQKYSLVLRRHVTQGVINDRQESWCRLSMDECSLDADVELDEHNSTCSSILTTSSNSSRSRSSISSTTASVLSLASISSNGSSRCSFSSNSSSGVSSGSSSSYSPNETPEKDRKVHPARRQLPPIPRSETPVSKVYPISVEENIQSYFSMPSDDELSEVTSVSETTNESSKRPPLPLPRRMLSFPITTANDHKVLNDSKSKSTTPSRPFCKSWSSSSCYSPLSWMKARGPAAQLWQSRSRSARIRSATISTPVEHMANISLSIRSRSSDQSRVSVGSEAGPVSPSDDKSIVFPHRSASLGRAQSASSITGTPSKSLDHPFIIPSSTKLRPLSLAPNSSIAFPARPSSLLSTQSHSTSTLIASSSTLSLTSPSAESKSQSFTISIGHLNAISQSPSLPSSPSDDHKCHSISQPQRDSGVETGSLNLNTKSSYGSNEKNSEKAAAEDVTNIGSKDSTSSFSLDGLKHCSSCCRYDNCFYI